MKKFLTAYKNPVLFAGYPFHLYVLVDNISDADNVRLVCTHHTTTYTGSQFQNKGIYQLPVQDTSNSFEAYVDAIKDSTTTVLTETLKCLTREKCDGIYLRWENDLGGYDYWLFAGNERDRINSGTRDQFQPFIEDIENKTGNFEIIKKRYDKTIRIFTDFPRNNVEGFEQLSRSRFVEMYYADQWWKVDIDIHTLSISKFQPYGKCAVDIILPQIYVK